MSYTTVRVNETFMLLRLIRKVFDNLDFDQQTNQLLLPPTGDIQKQLANISYVEEPLIRYTSETIQVILHSSIDSFERTTLLSKLSEFSLKAVFHKLKYRDARFIENVIENMYHAFGRVIDQLLDTLKQIIELLLPLNHVRYAIIEQKVHDMVKMDSMLIAHTLDQIKPWKAIAIDYIDNSFEDLDSDYTDFIKRYTSLIDSLHTLLRYMYYMTDDSLNGSEDIPPPVLYLNDNLLDEYEHWFEFPEITDKQTKIVHMMIYDLESFATQPHNKMLDLNEFCEPIDTKSSLDGEPSHRSCNYNVSYNFAAVMH